MILSKKDLLQKENNKKYKKRYAYLNQENTKFTNKYANRYLQKISNKKNNNSSSMKQVLCDNIFSKNYININDKIVEVNKSNKYNINNKMTKRNNFNSNFNSTKSRNTQYNQTKENINNIKEIMTDFNRYNNAVYNKRKEKEKMKPKYTSMEQRKLKLNDDIYLSEEIKDNNKINNIYYRYYNNHSNSSHLQKNYGNQFNIKDAQNILNINYFYDKNENNCENVENMIYTNFNNSKFLKKNKSIEIRNKYNSLIINDQPGTFTQDIPIKTTSNFYVRKNPINLYKHINNNFFKDDFISINENFRNKNYIETDQKNFKTKRNGIRYHSTIEKNNIHYSPDNFYNYTINNYNKFALNNKKIIRRNGNKIKILKKNNNTSIQEYNLSLGEEEKDSENDIEINQDVYITDSPNIGNKIYFLKNKTSRENNNLGDLKKYYQYFTKNIRPINIFQLEIKCKKLQSNLPNKNFINVNKAHNFYNSFQKGKSITNKKSNDINKLADKNKNAEGTSDYNRISTNANNNIIFNSNINVVDFEEKERIKINKKIFNFNDLIKISQNEKFEIISKKAEEKKLIFNNEDELIEYVYNKFEDERKKKNYFNKKLRFTGFVLSKKYKGKNLCDIRIGDDIDQINKLLKSENILINDNRVEFKYVDEMNNIKILENEIKKQKEENEKLKKQDNKKNELIKKLEDEKLNLNKEIIKLKKEISQQKEIRNEN